MAGNILDITVEGVEAVRRGLERNQRDFYRRQRVQMGKALNVIRAGVRASAKATFRRRSGRLIRNIGRKIFDSGGPEIQGQVALFRRQYYSILETGGTIRAKNGGFLTFPAVNGLNLGGVLAGTRSFGWVRVKEVRIRAHPFFGRGADSRREQAIDILGASFDVFVERGA